MIRPTGTGKPPRMKWYIKLLILIAVSTLVFYIGSMIYLVKAKYAMNDYTVHLTNAFNAATMVNASETFTAPESAVIAEYKDEKSIIVPENYKSLLTYLRMEHAMPLMGFVNKDDALHISICDKHHLYVQGDRNGQGATIRFETDTDRYTMHVTGSDLWNKILTISLEGSYKAENLPA